MSLYIKKCKYCDKEFSTNKINQIFDSSSCAKKYHKVKYRQKFKKNNIINPTYDIKTREQYYIIQFNNKHQNFTYISGYESYKSAIKIKCNLCGSIQYRNAHSKGNIRCDSCIKKLTEDKIKIKESVDEQKSKLKLEKEINTQQNLVIKNQFLKKQCSRCKNEYIADSTKRVHCDRCIEEIKKEKIIKRDLWNGKIIKCKECGKLFDMKYSKNVYCSEECKKQYNNRKKVIDRRNQLKINGAIDYSISLEKLIERDKNICHICCKECDKNDYIISKDGYFIAGDNYQSIDHVIPVSKGGTHTWDNVKLAHFRCNSIKRDNIIV